jgi:hypothetical protein
MLRTLTLLLFFATSSPLFADFFAEQEALEKEIEIKKSSYEIELDANISHNNQTIINLLESNLNCVAGTFSILVNRECYYQFYKLKTSSSSEIEKRERFHSLDMKCPSWEFFENIKDCK